jgi:WD40 repeat protein/tetratricopeptide (TPR) repeat protein
MEQPAELPEMRPWQAPAPAAPEAAAAAQAAAPAEPYLSLEQLKQEHSTLLRRRRTSFIENSEIIPEIVTFLARGAQTGTLLGGDDERYEAQDLLSYWSNILYRLEAKTANAVLAEFEPTRSPKLADSDNPYLNLDRPSAEGLARAPGWPRLIDESVRALGDNRLAAVVGASGGGRTVVVHCGLVPALRHGLIPGSAEWEYLHPFTPGEDPLANLVRALDPGADPATVASCADRIARAPQAQAQQLAARHPRPVVLVIDRFDEVLTRSIPERARAFEEALLALVEVPEPGHRVVGTLDPGGLGQAEVFGPLGQRLLQGQVLVTFTAAELRQMVLAPAKRIGLRFDDDRLVNRLLMDVQGDPAALALLQFTLQRLWSEREGNRITHEAYDRVGGGRLAVARWAEKVYAGLPPEEQVAAKAILLRLARPALGAGVSCQRLPLDQLVPQTDRESPAQRVLKRLVDAGLVVPIESTEDGSPEYTPVHESLATAWPRFLQWLEDVRGTQQWRLRLRAAAQQWQSQGRQEGALWSGAVLVLALEETDRLRAAGESLDQIEQRFLDASQTLDRRRRLTRWGLIAGGVVLCVVLVAVYIIRQKEIAAIEKKNAADQKKLRKEADLSNAAWQFKAGTELAAKTWDTSGAFLWYAKAWSTFDKSGGPSEATERERLREGYLIRLGVARRQLPALAVMAYHHNPSASSSGPDWTPDGKVMLTVGVEGPDQPVRPVASLWRWKDTHSGGKWVVSALPKWQPPKDTADVTGCYLGKKGEVAIVTTKIGETAWRASIWSIRPNAPPRLKYQEKHPGRWTGAALSPDGKFFAVVSSPEKPPPRGEASLSQVTLWQAKQWMKPLDILPPGKVGPLGSPAFSPNSDRLAVPVGSNLPGSGANRVVCLEWSLKSSPPGRHPKKYTNDVFPPPSQTGEETTFAVYGPSGEDQPLFVTRGRENHRPEAWVFNSQVDSPPPASPLWHYHREPILWAAFSPRGDWLATAGADGQALLFPRNQLTSRFDMWRYPPLKHGARVWYTEFSPDGQYLVTASRDRSAQVWDVETRQPAHPSLQHTGTVNMARFTPNGRQVITASQNTVYRWDLTRGEARPLLLGVPQRVGGLTLDAQGRSVIAAGDRPSRAGQREPEGWAQVWDAETGRPRTPLLPHTTSVRHAAISPADTGFVSTVSADGTIRLWKISAPDDPIQSVLPNPWRAIYTAFGHQRQKLYLLAVTREKQDDTSGRGSVLVWSVSAKGRLRTAGKFVWKGPLTAAAFSPDCKRVVAFTGRGPQGVAVVWEVGSKNPPASLRRKGSKVAHDEAITSAAFSRDGKHLITTGKDDTAMVWSWPDWGGTKLEGRRRDVVEKGHTADVLFAVFDRTGRRVVTAGADRRVIVWERPEEKAAFRPVVALNLETTPVQVLFNPDQGQRYVLTASNNGTIQLWDAKDGRVIAMKRHLGQVRRMRWTANKSSLKVRILGVRVRRPDSPPWRRSGNITHSPELAALTVSNWDLTPAEQPPADQLLMFAELIAGRRLVSKQDLTQVSPLTAEEVHKRWVTVKKTGPPKPRPTTPAGAVEWHKREADAAESVGRWAAAEWHLREALKILPKARPRFPLFARMARVHVQAGELIKEEKDSQARKDWQRAEQDLSKALQGWEWDRDLLWARAEARIRIGRSREAIQDYLSVLKRDPDDDLTRAQLAHAYDQAGNPKAAGAEYDKVVRGDRPNPNLLLRRAIFLAKKENRQFDRAFEDFLAAAREFKQQRRLKDAWETYGKALALCNKHVKPPPSDQVKIYFELVEVLEQIRRWDKVIKAVDEAIKLTPNDVTLLQKKADALNQLKEWEKAAEAYRAVIKLQPRVLWHRLRLAAALIQLKKWEEAAEAYRAVIKLEPKVLSYRLRLAEISLQKIPPNKLVRSEQWKEARLCLEEATKDFEKESRVWVYLAYVQLAAGDVKRYQETRSRMLKLFGAAGPVAANDVAWVSSLAANTDGAAEALRLAQRAAKAYPNYAGYLNTLGAALYRAGELEEATVKLKEAAGLRVQPFIRPDQVALGKALDLLFLAMVEHTLKHRKQARDTLRSAFREIDRYNAFRRGESPDLSLSRVWDRLQLQIIQREAENLIKKP